MNNVSRKKQHRAGVAVRNDGGPTPHAHRVGRAARFIAAVFFLARCGDPLEGTGPNGSPDGGVGGAGGRGGADGGRLDDAGAGGTAGLEEQVVQPARAVLVERASPAVRAALLERAERAAPVDRAAPAERVEAPVRVPALALPAKQAQADPTTAAVERVARKTAAARRREWRRWRRKCDRWLRRPRWQRGASGCERRRRPGGIRRRRGYGREQWCGRRTGGASDAGGCPSTLVGWATIAGDGVTATSGGGNAAPVRPTTAAALMTYASDSAPRVIEIAGTFDVPSLTVASDKTLIGIGANATINGGLQIRGDDSAPVRNVIVQKPQDQRRENPGRQRRRADLFRPSRLDRPLRYLGRSGRQSRHEPCGELDHGFVHQVPLYARPISGRRARPPTTGSRA